MTQDVILGVVGTAVGAGAGIGGWRLGVRLAGPRGLDERHGWIRNRAGHVAWALTMAALMAMWFLVEMRVVTSAGVVIWAVFLFSLCSYVTAGVVVDRRH